MRCKPMNEFYNCSQARILVIGLTYSRLLFYSQCLANRIRERAKMAVFQVTGELPSDSTSERKNKPSDKEKLPSFNRHQVAALRYHADAAVAHWKRKVASDPSDENKRTLKHATRKQWSSEREDAHFGDNPVAKRCSVSDLLWEKWVESNRKLTWDNIEALKAFDKARSVLYRREDDPDMPPCQEYLETLPQDIIDKAFADMAIAMKGMSNAGQKS